MTTPTERSVAFTQRELQNRAKEFMKRFYGKPECGNDDRWMERFGLLCAFIDGLFELEEEMAKLRD